MSVGGDDSSTFTNNYNSDIEKLVQCNPLPHNSSKLEKIPKSSSLIEEVKDANDNDNGTITIEDKKDSNSKTSDKTEVNQNTVEYHYNDSDGKISWKEVTMVKGDDKNTVNSDQRSQVKRSDEKKMILPSFIRYQMMILLDQNHDESLIAEVIEEEKSPLEIIRDFLNSLVGQLKIHDKDTKIISWKNAGNFTYMNTDDFTTDFQGYRKNLKADKIIYLRIGIHTPNSQSRLLSLMDAWMKFHGNSFSQCIIQSESSTCIGWLV